MVSTIEVLKIDRFRQNVRIDSKCGMINKLVKELTEVDIREVLKSQGESSVYKEASKAATHAACPIPMAITKAIEVEAGMALPRPVSVTFELKVTQ